MPHHPVMRSVWAAVVILSALTPIVPAHAGASVLTYSPWTKFCFKEICFIGADGRIAPDCGAQGPAQQPKAFVSQPGKLQDELKAARDANRKTRCGED
jgi:hypothetical protein